MTQDKLLRLGAAGLLFIFAAAAQTLQQAENFVEGAALRRRQRSLQGARGQVSRTTPTSRRATAA